MSYQRLASLLVLAALVGGGCAARVKPRQSPPAELNLTKYQRVAVLDFEGAKADWGKRIALLLKEELHKARVEGRAYFEVVGPTRLAEMLKERGFKVEGLRDPRTRSPLARLLGIDALITGRVNKLESREFIASHWRPYVILTARADLRIRFIGIARGKVEVDENFSAEETEETYGPAELAEFEYRREPLTSCVRAALRKFVRKITPHYATLRPELRSEYDSLARPANWNFGH